LDAEEVEAALADVGGTCVIANDNCPGQIVISGEIDAVQAASARCAERGAKRVLPLPVSGAFHSPLMDGAAAQLSEAIEQV
ncbi:[acyl-carrier-protein] S-malonyltransferase, partial [Acinetobacter baumannii]